MWHGFIEHAIGRASDAGRQAACEEGHAAHSAPGAPQGVCDDLGRVREPRQQDARDDDRVVERPARMRTSALSGAARNSRTSCDQRSCYMRLAYWALTETYVCGSRSPAAGGSQEAGEAGRGQKQGHPNQWQADAGGMVTAGRTAQLWSGCSPFTLSAFLPVCVPLTVMRMTMVWASLLRAGSHGVAGGQLTGSWRSRSSGPAPRRSCPG